MRGESSNWQQSFRDVNYKKDLPLLFPEYHGLNRQIIDFCSDLSHQKLTNSQHKLTNSLRSSKNHDEEKKSGEILPNPDEYEVSSYNFRMVVLSKAAIEYMVHYIEVKYINSCHYVVYE